MLEILVDRIDASGPITFAAFMEAALYHPEHGYYGAERSPWGRQGDYLTAPQVSGALGRCVARLLVEADAALGHPDPLDLVEVGSGDGALLDAVLGELHEAGVAGPVVASRLRAHSVERGRASRERQRRRFAGRDGVSVVGTLGALPDAARTGLVYANELLDAFPVHRVRGAAGGRLREAYVDVGEGGGLEERWGSPSTPELESHLVAAGVRLQPGQEAEVCLRLRPWLRRLSRGLDRGYLLTVDYGHDTAALYDPEQRPRGTLAAMHRYRVHDRYLERVGAQDLTAHVDLGLVQRAGADVGLESQGVCSLGVFLLGLGAAEGAGLQGGDPDPRRHLALRHLLFSEIAHTHRALLQRRNAPPLAWGRERIEPVRDPAAASGRPDVSDTDR